MRFYEPDEAKDILHPNPDIWLEFRLLNPPAPEQPGSLDALATFSLFTSLPPELRLKIYSMSLVPRTVLLTCNISSPTHSTFPLSYPDTNPTKPRPRPRFSSPPPPPLLHVSRETREFAQRHYIPSFGYRISPLHTSTPLRLSPRVFFDFARDSLLLAGELEPADVHGLHGPMVYFLDRGECARVRRVACRADALRSTAPAPAPRDLPVGPGGVPTHAFGTRQEVDDEVVFVMLSHVLDQFSSVKTLLVPFDRDRRAESAPEDPGPVSWEEGTPDAIQKIWDGWVLGITAANSSLRGKRIPLVREDELEEAWDRQY